MATNRSADTAQKPVCVHSVQRMKREEIKVCEVKHLEDSADLLRTTLEIRLNSHNGQDVQQALWASARSVTRSTTADYSTSTRSRNVNTETVSLLPVQPHESLSLFLVKELLRIQHMTMLQQLHLPEHS